MNELQRKILEVLRDLQCYEHEDGSFHFNDDETPLATYKRLERELSVEKSRLKIEVIALRNMGYVELSPSVDSDYFPNGSGWMITEKGVGIINANHPQP